MSRRCDHDHFDVELTDTYLVLQDVALGGVVHERVFCSLFCLGHWARFVSKQISEWAREPVTEEAA